MLVSRFCDWSDRDYWSKKSILNVLLFCLSNTTDLLTDC